MALVSAAILFMNGVALFVISKLGHSRTPSMLLISTLTCMDFMVGISSVGYTATHYFSTRHLQQSDSEGNSSMTKYDVSEGYVYSCLFSLYLTEISVTGSAASVLAIAVDRYIAVIYPLRYPDILTMFRVKILIGLEWLVILLMDSYIFWAPLSAWYKSTECQLLTWFGHFYHVGFYLSTLVFSIACTTILYLGIVNAAIKQRRKIAGEQIRVKVARTDSEVITERTDDMHSCNDVMPTHNYDASACSDVIQSQNDEMPERSVPTCSGDSTRNSNVTYSRSDVTVSSIETLAERTDSIQTRIDVMKLSNGMPATPKRDIKIKNIVEFNKATKNMHSNERNQWRITKMLMTVIGVFYICCLPYIVLSIYLMSTSLYEHYTNTELQTIYTGTKALIAINSLINPCIYIGKDRQMRHMLKGMCYQMCCTTKTDSLK